MSETEWVETVEASWNVLAGCEPQRILEAVRTMRPTSKSAAPYGDAAERMVGIVVTALALSYYSAAL